MKTSNPRTFTGLARSGHKRAGVNSGILSDSGAGQKMDKVKPSPGIAAADRGALKSALNVPAKKTVSGKGKNHAGRVAEGKRVQKQALKV